MQYRAENKTISLLKDFCKRVLYKLHVIKPLNRFVPYQRKFLGHVINIHDYASFKIGESELFQQQQYRFETSKKNPVIVDCGANLGMSVIYFKSLYPDAEIKAFEADPYIFSFLEKNIKSFNYSNVEIINKAVWNKSGEILSFLSEGGAGGRLQEKNSNQKFIEVKTTRLKDYLQADVDFLKLDIEGAEFTVLNDCADSLSKVQNIFIEYHSFEGTQQNLHKILEIVHNNGFNYHIHEAYTSPTPFILRGISSGMDLQLNIYCYRA